jgi:hypothetical protein
VSSPASAARRLKASAIRGRLEIEELRVTAAERDELFVGSLFN